MVVKVQDIRIEQAIFLAILFRLSRRVETLMKSILVAILSRLFFQCGIEIRLPISLREI